MNSFRYPAEWEEQHCTWLSWPFNINEWGESRLNKISKFYLDLIFNILDFQNVKLIFSNEILFNDFVKHGFENQFTNKKFKLYKLIIPCNDIWIRDYGPFFMKGNHEKLILDFEFNSWGAKFPPWDLDNDVPKKIAQITGDKIESYPLILEGGALEFNGNDLVITTKQCLLNKNRNPYISQETYETILKQAFNIEEIIWIERGLEGDHTDGHIDDFIRFVNEDSIIACKANSDDENYNHLNTTIQYLKNWKSQKGKSLNIIEIPMPQALYLNNERLPNSYANFIFVNNGIILPLFNCKEDEKAISIFKNIFPDRTIVGIDSTVLIQEGGGIHCMSKQEPK